MRVKAISFDFWNTLFEEQPGGFEFYNYRRRMFLSEVAGGHRRVTYDEIDRACRAEAESHFLIWRNEHRTLRTADRVDRILAELDVVLNEHARLRLIKVYEEGILERPPLLVAGAREVVEALHGRYRLGVISDVGFSPGRVLKEILRNNGLLNAFDSLVFSDEAGRAKPHAEVFERTARALKSDPDQVLHIGDLEPTDVVGAKSAGYFAVRFTGVTPMSDGESTVADCVIRDLRELPGAIAATPLGIECL